MVMFSTVSCSQEGPTEETLDAANGQITCRVKLRCNWSDRLALCDDLLLNQRPWPYITTSFTPVAINASATWSFNEAKGVQTGQGYEPSYAIVTVNYGIPKYDEDLLSESLEPSGEFVRLPYTMFRWGSRTGDPIQPEESPGVFDARLKLVRKYYRIATIPANALSAFGKCNQSAYSSALLGVTFPAETLLYDTPFFDRTISTAGSQGWNYTQNWIYNPNQWNKYYRAKTNTWEYQYRVDTTGVATPFKSYVPDPMTGLLL